MPNPDNAGSPREVRVGDRHITIEAPNAFKFLEATELIGQISERVPELQDRNEKFVAEYRTQNEEVLTRPVALLKYPGPFGDLSDEWWEERGGSITIPGDPPGGFEQGLAMFKYVYQAARDPLVRMIALLAAPAGELETADVQGGDALNTYLAGFARQLMHKGRLTDMVLILTSSLEAMRDEFEADADARRALGEIQGFLGRRTVPTEATQTPSERSTSESSSQPIEPPPATAEPSAPASDASEPRPTSSTSSPTPTAGPAETSSTDPAGPSSATFEPASTAGS